ncbi:phosphopantetheine-binding protein [Kitasatospora sp. NBC_01246]|uniref:phosphopantetheine-binding protein n=1 Tax=Kitasatospora sp. NBC_01246 TaxID=2903570 RepID=UPI002E314507|nr:phosphopantetheine-binding protein [Kitasatospora sp. NBC_01246]
MKTGDSDHRSNILVRFQLSHGRLPLRRTRALRGFTAHVRYGHIRRTPAGRTAQGGFPWCHTGSWQGVPSDRPWTARLPAKRDTLNPTEARLAEIWRTVLGISEVGREDDFFAIGGDSLLMAKAVGHIRRTWLIEINLRDLIERPVLSELAHWVDQRAADVPAASHAERD